MNKLFLLACVIVTFGTINLLAEPLGSVCSCAGGKGQGIYIRMNGHIKCSC